jgi:hypothetical protein
MGFGAVGTTLIIMSEPPRESVALEGDDSSGDEI